MCGIVGLFLKDPRLEPRRGELLAEMLVTMTDRGPDSAGIAIYGRPRAGHAKLMVQSSDPGADFATLAEELGAALGGAVALEAKDSHAVIEVEAERLGAVVCGCGPRG